MKMYSAPDAALIGKRPVRSECAVCESGITFVYAVRRGCEVSFVSLSSRSSEAVESSPCLCWSRWPRPVVAVRDK